MKRESCPTCPWRKSTPPRGFPGGSLSPKLRQMASGEFCMDAMQCHCTPDGPSAQVCVGFAIQVGFDCVGLRLAALLGRYDPETVTAEGIELWPTAEHLFHVHGEAE